jgi:hypothetical protein
MGIVTVGAATRTIYGEQLGAGSCDEYADASFAFAATWDGADVDYQARALIAGTGVLVRQPWTDPTHADPSTPGLPAVIIEACYELALGILSGKLDAATGMPVSANVKSVDDGVVAMSFFGAGGQGGAAAPVWFDMISRLLGGGGASTGSSSASGSNGESDFDACDTFGITT